ncbi:MAG: hypothetical protein IPP72_15185 [Chitinophagaceae bacterium]|nr:hypothetical protein [Chitinophagaceae bacterium]
MARKASFIFREARFFLWYNFTAKWIAERSKATNTLLKFNLSGSGNLITVSGSVTHADSANIVSVAAKGATTVTVDNPGLFHINDHMKIYQNDAALVNDSWALGSVAQLLRIENITGNNISFSNPYAVLIH